MELTWTIQARPPCDTWWMHRDWQRTPGESTVRGTWSQICYAFANSFANLTPEQYSAAVEGILFMYMAIPLLVQIPLPVRLGHQLLVQRDSVVMVAERVLHMALVCAVLPAAMV